MDKVFKQLLARMFFFKRKIILMRKVSHLCSIIPGNYSLSGEVISDHKALWRKLGSRPGIKWLKLYSFVSGREDSGYITEPDFYNKVEPTLNNRTFSDAYADKNSYHRFLRRELLPSVYLRNIEGSFYDEAYRPIELHDQILDLIPGEADTLIAKAAVESGGGRGVELFSREGFSWKNSKGTHLTIEYLTAIFGKNYLLQEYICQDHFYSRFNPSSVNTVRLLTYKSVRTNEIIPLQAVLRIGKPGSVVDNQASGGIACGISHEGFMNEYAVNKSGNKTYSSGGIDFRDAGKLYKFNEIISAGIEVARAYYFQRLLGLDICVDNKGAVRIIEVNNRNNEINFFQMNNGPLFREYTGEVIEYCQQRPTSFAIDFDF
jgi:hypothetical protein